MIMQNTGRRLCALLCSMLLCVGVLTGCGGEEEAAQVTLRTISVMGDDGPKQAYTALVEQFSAEYPHVYHLGTVAETSNAYMLYASFEDTYTASKYPHAVYYYTGSEMDDLSEHFVSVEEIRQTYPEFASGVTDAALDSVRLSDGKCYCVPFAGEWKALAVNNSLLQSCGLAMPRDRESFVKAAGTLAEKGIIPVAVTPEHSGTLFELLCCAADGGKTLDSLLGGDYSLTQSQREIWLEIFTAYSELCSAKAFPDGTMTEELLQALSLRNSVSASDAFSAAVDNPPAQAEPAELFNAGKAAMLIADMDTYGEITLEDYSLVAFPDYFGQGKTILTGGYTTGWYITRRAFNDKSVRDAAVAYVDAMTRSEAAQSFAALGYLPSAEEYVTEAPLPQEQEVPRYIENGLWELAADADEIMLSRMTSAGSGVFSRLEYIASALWAEVITPAQGVQLLEDFALELTDVIELPRPAVSASDAAASGSDAAVSGSDAGAA